MSEALEAVPHAPLSAATLEAVVVSGNLASLTPAQRLEYYRARCLSAGLDPAAQPFQYIVLNGKLTLYASKSCTDQLSRVHGIKVAILSQVTESGLRVVQVRAETKDGRATEEIGAVPIEGLKGDALGNAMMKAVTKAKRRAILSMCGLGVLDESETETVPGARTIEVNADTGEIVPEGDRPSPFTSREQAEVDAFATGEPRGPQLERRIILGIPVTIPKTWEQVRTVPVSSLNAKSPYAKLTLGELIDEEKSDDGRLDYFEGEVIRKIQEAWGRMSPNQKAKGIPLPGQLALIAYDELQNRRSPPPTHFEPEA